MPDILPDYETYQAAHAKRKDEQESVLKALGYAQMPDGSYKKLPTAAETEMEGLELEEQKLDVQAKQKELTGEEDILASVREDAAGHYKTLQEWQINEKEIPTELFRFLRLTYGQDEVTDDQIREIVKALEIPLEPPAPAEQPSEQPTTRPSHLNWPQFTPEAQAAAQKILKSPIEALRAPKKVYDWLKKRK